MSGTTYFLEISPLQELRYTGIPKVALEVARYLLPRDDVQFFWDDYVVPKDFVASMVASETGASFAAIASRKIEFDTVLTHMRRCSKSVAIFPNVMTRTFFDRHVQIVHDLVFLVAPEYHGIETITHHSSTIQRDTDKADALICVSQSTAQDVISYMGVAPEKVKVVLNGVDAPADDHISGNLERFILVVGTIEPRKNIEIIMKYLASHEEVLKDYTFVFCGKDGWIISFDALVDKYDLRKHVISGKIVRFPFVSEELKWKLLRHAALLIFPSLYEGFGLPVIEALAANTPVLASWSSSIPEVGGDLVTYFDPTDYIDFEGALSDILSNHCSITPDWTAKVEEFIKGAAWQRFGDEIMQICASL